MMGDDEHERWCKDHGGTLGKEKEGELRQCFFPGESYSPPKIFKVFSTYQDNYGERKAGVKFFPKKKDADRYATAQLALMKKSVLESDDPEGVYVENERGASVESWDSSGDGEIHHRRKADTLSEVIPSQRED